MCYAVFGVIAAVISMPATMFLIRSYPKDAGLKPYGKPEEISQNSKPLNQGKSEHNQLKQNHEESSHSGENHFDQSPSYRRAGSVSAKRAFECLRFFFWPSLSL